VILLSMVYYLTLYYARDLEACKVCYNEYCYTFLVESFLRSSFWTSPLVLVKPLIDGSVHCASLCGMQPG
jgi:hypothetical protein